MAVMVRASADADLGGKPQPSGSKRAQSAASASMVEAIRGWVADRAKSAASSGDSGGFEPGSEHFEPGRERPALKHADQTAEAPREMSGRRRAF